MPALPEWSVGLELSESEISAFDSVASALGAKPSALIDAMVRHVLASDSHMRSLGLNGIAAFATGREAIDDVAKDCIHGLPLDIRPSGFMWPADTAFPWSAQECLAAVVGYEVKWKGSFDDFLTHLRGLWEMSEGYAVLRQP